MGSIDAVDRVFRNADMFSDPEVTVSQSVDHEAAVAAVDKVIADPATATAEDWQAAQELYPEAFEDGGDR